MDKSPRKRKEDNEALFMRLLKKVPVDSRPRLAALGARVDELASEMHSIAQEVSRIVSDESFRRVCYLHKNEPDGEVSKVKGRLAIAAEKSAVLHAEMEAGKLTREEYENQVVALTA